MQEKNNNSASQINLADLFFFLLSKWYWFVLCVALCMGYAYYRYAKTPRIWRSDATIIIKDPSNTRSTIRMGEYSNMINHVSMSNEILQLKSKHLMGEVVKALDADVNYTMHDGLREVELYDKAPVKMNVSRGEGPDRYIRFGLTPLADSKVRLSIDGEGDRTVALGDTVSLGGTAVVFNPTASFSSYSGKKITLTKIPFSSAVAAFLSRLKVEQMEEEGSILYLSMQDFSLSRACDILNTLVDKYNEDAIREKNRIAVNTASFINDRIAIIQSELGAVEGDLARYQSSQRIMDVDAAASEYLSQSKTYGKEIVDVEAKARAAGIFRDYLQSSFLKYEPVSTNTGLEDAGINSSISAYNDLILQRDGLIRASSPESPAVKQTEEKIAPLTKNILFSIDNLITSLKSKGEDLSKLEQESISKFTTMPAKARELLSIERQQQIKETLYIFLLNKREENALTQAMADNNARMVDTAEGPSWPIYPSGNKMLLLALLVGLFVPAVILVSKLLMDTKIRGRKDIEAISSVPFLSDVPSIEKRKGLFKKQAPVVSGKPTAEYNDHEAKVFREVMRMICTNLDFMKPEDCPHPAIMVSSFNSGVGKSFIARNVAACLADARKKVIIIDTDLRKRSTSNFFGLRHKTTGLSNYLVDSSVGENDIIRKDILEGVDFIPAGHIPPNPTEILGRNRMDALIEQLKSRYDFIILDGTPVNMVADSMVLGRLADMNLFILRSGISDRRQLPLVQELFKDGRLKNFSLILNGLDSRSGYGYGYSYGYGYGYGYGSGYGSYYEAQDDED